MLDADGLAGESEALVRKRIFEELVHRMQSRGGLIASTQKIVKENGFCGFFVFELLCPASLLSCMGTLPIDLIESIKRNDFHLSDQVLFHVLNAKQLGRPVFRSVVDEYIVAAPWDAPAIRRHKEFVKNLRDLHGIRDIYYWPHKNRNYGNPIAFCLFTTNEAHLFRGKIKRVEPLLEPMCDAFIHVAKSAKTPLIGALATKFVTARVIQVLNYMMHKDLSASEVARLLGLHEVTVNKHVGDAKRKLGANTLLGLAAEMIKQGIYFPDLES